MNVGGELFGESMLVLVRWEGRREDRSITSGR